MIIEKPEARKKKFYFSYYIQLPEQDNLLNALEASKNEVVTLFSNLKEEQGSFSYAEGKWTLKQLLNHLTDTERILSTRALRFSRNDTATLPGYEEDFFAKHDNTDNLTIKDLLAEYEAVKNTTILLFKNMNPFTLDNMGDANGLKISVREIGWTLAGHDLHHLAIVKERYL